MWVWWGGHLRGRAVMRDVRPSLIICAVVCVVVLLSFRLHPMCRSQNFEFTQVKNLQFRMCNGASIIVTSHSLPTEPLWSGHSGDRVRVSNLVGAYKTRYRMEAGCAWSPCVWKSVLSWAVLALGNVTKMNRRVVVLFVLVSVQSLQKVQDHRAAQGHRARWRGIDRRPCGTFL